MTATKFDLISAVARGMNSLKTSLPKSSKP